MRCINFVQFRKNLYKSWKDVITIYTLEEYINDLLNRVDTIEKKLELPQSGDADPGAIPLPTGPGTPLQIFAENINVDLDPDKFPWDGPYQDGYVIADENDSMLWVWYYIGPVNSNYQVVTFRGKINGVNKGNAAVAGCCTEWNPDIKPQRPKMGMGTKCFVYGTERGEDAIRVIGGHNNKEDVHLAIGFMVPVK